MRKTLILHDNEYKKWNEKKEDSMEEISLNMISNSEPSPFKVSQNFSETVGYETYKAFDNNVNTHLLMASNNSIATTPSVISVDLGSLYDFCAYSFFVNASDQAPSTWILEGSVDNNSWIELDKIDKYLMKDNTTEKFNVKTVKNIRFLRLKIYAIKYNTEKNSYIESRVRITELKFFKLINGQPSYYSTHQLSEIQTEGMDSLSPLLDRRVETLEPLPMSKSEILLQNGKMFTKTIDLNKYMDIRSINVEVE